MLLFHEGLPRSGKSFEAVAVQIAKALRAKRGVTAYVEGLDHAKIAPLVGCTLDECKDLLKVVTREQSSEIWKHVRDNDLIVIDEVANKWHNRARLPEAAMEFFKEHGHHGQDILLMDQDLRDVHAVIRRRVEIKLCFLKLSALGAENRYSVTTYRHKGADEFERVGTQINKYDKAWYGTYASHVGEDIQTGNFKDARASVMSASVIRYGLPLALVAGVWGFWSAWKFFHPEPTSKPVPQATAPAPGKSAPPVPVEPAKLVQAISAPPSTVQESHLAQMSSKARLRLAGLLTMKGKADGVIEWVEGTRVTERLTFEELRQLGVSLVVSQSVVRLYLGNWQAMATMWPMDVPGVASESTLRAMREQAGTQEAKGPYVYIPEPQIKASKGEDLTLGKKPV